MFEGITRSLSDAFKKLRGRGRLTAENIKDGLREVRRAFLEADVNYNVVTEFIGRVEAKSVGQDVLARVDPSEQAAGAIAYAQKKLGTLYLWGGDGTAEDGGRFDCSGLTKAAYESVGISLPRVANDQYNAGPHPSREELLPGDLVFFSDDLTNSRAIRHVGIYVGGGYMIDAPRTGAVIRFDPIDTPDYFGATRVTEDGAKALPTSV